MARLPGTIDAKLKLLSTLDEDTFPHLIADILAFVKGHSDVRVVDGPGDGRRDIHSVRSGHRHITQCKFHKDPNVSVGSQETDQIVIALGKFDVTHGLFATTGKVSPQSQREYLDYYKQYKLDFIQGSDLVDLVLSNPVLSSVWFDGEAIYEVRHTIAIPFLARDLATDRPIEDLTIVGRTELSDRVDMTIQSGTHALQVFEPYRPPRIRTLKEGWRPYIMSCAAVFSGRCSLYRLDEFSKEILKVIETSLPPQHGPVAVRLGSPYLTVDGEEAEVKKVDLNLEARTFGLVGTGSWTSEIDWLLPAPGAPWEWPERYSAMEADWVRWYNHSLDCCLNLELLSPPGPSSAVGMAERREFQRYWWRKSLFAAGTKPQCNMFVESLAKADRPTTVYEHGPSGQLLAWIHGNLSPGLRPLMVDYDHSEEDDPLLQQVHGTEVAFEQGAARIRSLFKKYGLTEVEGETARHIAAADGKDPYPETPEIIYRPIDLVHSLYDIPSPIDPTSRRFQFEKVWLVKDTVRSVRRRLADLSVPFQDTDITWAGFGADPRGYTFALISVNVACTGSESTTEWLAAAGFLLERLSWLSKWVSANWSGAKPATKEFWLKYCGLMLPGGYRPRVISPVVPNTREDGPGAPTGR